MQHARSSCHHHRHRSLLLDASQYAGSNSHVGRSSGASKCVLPGCGSGVAGTLKSDPGSAQ
eukprot:1316672-Amphidinium_carterae.1